MILSESYSSQSLGQEYKRDPYPTLHVTSTVTYCEILTQLYIPFQSINGRPQPKPTHALVAALYDELALLEECPQETRAIVKKLNGLLQQLQQLEPAMGGLAEIDRFADLESPWGSESEPGTSDRGDFSPELGDLEEWLLEEAVGSDEDSIDSQLG